MVPGARCVIIPLGSRPAEPLSKAFPNLRMEQNMKQRNERVGTAKFLQGLWPGVLMGSLALAGPAAAAQAGASAAAPAADSRTAAHTLYRVINVGPGDAAYAMNEKDQVAFTHVDPWSGLPPEAWFFDGARLHKIPTLGGTSIRTTDVNDFGVVTGISETASGLIHSFVWSLRHGLTDIGTLPGRNGTWEPVINNRGEVAGYATADPSPPYPHAFRWSARSGIEDLGVVVPGDASSSYARAINDAGLITGDAWAGGSNYHAFLWTRATGMVDIDTLGARRSSPVAIGAKGQVAGNLLNDPHNYGSAFWWTRATGMRELGPGDGQGSGMFAMSSGGRIAGVITYASQFERAMTWTLEHGMRNLGTLGGHRSNANAANNKGQVVGGSVTPEDVYHAFVWTEKEGMVDLNRRLYHPPAGLVLDSALAISDNGSILAVSNAGLVLLKPVQACTCGHAVGPIASAGLVQVGAPVDTSIGIAHGQSASRYGVTWSWGDGTADRARDATAGNDGANASARHTYSAPGIYTVTADVVDQAGNSAKASRSIVVYAPSGGVTGGAGTVVLPATAKFHSPVSGGMAHFGFLAPAAGQAKAAGAQGSFLFSLPGFAFASTDVHVFAAHGASAQLVGTGKVNGTGSYNFTATATAGTGGDKAGGFSVKIWHADPNTNAEVVDYDTRDAGSRNAGRPLAEGSIVVQ
jgi:probable HAF family extracellular repeat protein